MNDHGINAAFEKCLEECLIKLQMKNPALFPSAAIIKREHRDNRYVPLISSALAAICNRSSRKDMQQTILSWSNDVSQAPSQTLDILTDNIERRIRQVLSLKEKETMAAKSTAKRGKRRDITPEEVNDDESDHDTASSNKSLSQIILGDAYFNHADKSNEREIALTDDWCNGQGSIKGSSTISVAASHHNEFYEWSGNSLVYDQENTAPYIPLAPLAADADELFVFDEW